MIEQLHIKGFRCLRDVRLRLGSLTALVGPNAVGKSALLEAFDPQRTLKSRDRWRQLEADAWVELTRDGLARDGTWSMGRSLINTVPPNGHYTYQSIQLRPSDLRQPNSASRETLLSRTGSNLINALATLPRRVQFDIAGQLCQLVPMFRDVDVRPEGGGYLQLRFEDRWQPGLWYTPDQVSDGTMLVLAFLVLQRQEQPPDLLCIDDPEQGLHPLLLGQVVDLLRKLSRGELGGRAVQVLLASHSAELLDHLEPDEVRFLSRDPSDGGTVVEEAATDTPEWREAYENYQRSLGAMWLSGGLGGVPGS